MFSFSKKYFIINICQFSCTFNENTCEIFYVYVFVAFGRVTNFHKLSNLKQYPLISWQYCRSEVGVSVQVAEGQNQSDTWAKFSSGGSGKNHFQAHSCQQDSVPQDGRAEVLTSLLLVSWGLLLTAGGHLSPFGMGFPWSASQQWSIDSWLCFESLASSLISWRKCFALEGLTWFGQANWNTLPVSRTTVSYYMI